MSYMSTDGTRPVTDQNDENIAIQVIQFKTLSNQKRIA